MDIYKLVQKIEDSLWFFIDVHVETVVVKQTLSTIWSWPISEIGFYRSAQFSVVDDIYWHVKEREESSKDRD